MLMCWHLMLAHKASCQFYCDYNATSGTMYSLSSFVYAWVLLLLCRSAMPSRHQLCTMWHIRVAQCLLMMRWWMQQLPRHSRWAGARWGGLMRSEPCLQCITDNVIFTPELAPHSMHGMHACRMKGIPVPCTHV